MSTGVGNKNNDSSMASTWTDRRANAAGYQRPEGGAVARQQLSVVDANRRAVLTPAARACWTIVMIAALAAVGWAIYSISHGMRTVMMMGGSCASAGSGYDLPTCPPGAGGQVVLGILGGLLASGIAGVAAARLRRRQLVLFAWPALFALLGWNFLDFSWRAAAAGAAGQSTSWLICGVLFEVMAFFPLVGGVILLVRSMVRSRRATLAR